ncbi:MAG: methyltransferase domain-containing protein [Terracidiphilus sp.]|nr:methyltransferase domain-containing protein [Terracidiphilus sp.]
MNTAQHDVEIHDQFTRQAEPFLERHGRGKDALLGLMAECAAPRPTDTLLDVACGPGIISCFFAPLAARVTGLDMVPAMLEQARRLQAEKQLPNIEWKLGQSTELPFADETFDCVVTRFSFHHYMDPQAALREMRRVCESGGTVLVADVAPRREVQDRFNHWEILRDPSHTCALTLAEMKALGEGAGLELRRQENFSFVMELEDLLAGSFPKPGDGDRIRALFAEDIAAGRDSLGVAARREEGVIRLTYPVAVLAWRKP